MKVLPWHRHDRYIDTGVKDEAGQPIIITPAEVEDYLDDPEFRHYLNLWNISELIKEPPFDGGWATWPYDILTAFLAFHGEDANLAREHDKKHKPKEDPSWFSALKKGKGRERKT